VVEEGDVRVWQTFRDGRYLRVCLTADAISFGMAPTGDAAGSSAFTAWTYGVDAVDVAEVVHQMTLSREPVARDPGTEHIADVDAAYLRAWARSRARPGDAALEDEARRLEAERQRVAYIGTDPPSRIQ
jgi:hypothetical protein